MDAALAKFIKAADTHTNISPHALQLIKLK